MAVPPAGVLLRVAQLSIQEDRPIYLDYYQDSLESKCYIGVRENEKNLIKNDNEYTSGIQSVSKCESCYIIMTENSLYIVSKDIPIKKVLPTQN
jgi:hypothetical protein